MGICTMRTNGVFLCSILCLVFLVSRTKALVTSSTTGFIGEDIVLDSHFGMVSFRWLRWYKNDQMLCQFRKSLIGNRTKTFHEFKNLDGRGEFNKITGDYSIRDLTWSDSDRFTCELQGAVFNWKRTAYIYLTIEDRSGQRESERETATKTKEELSSSESEEKTTEPPSKGKNKNKLTRGQRKKEIAASGQKKNIIIGVVLGEEVGEIDVDCEMFNNSAYAGLESVRREENKPCDNHYVSQNEMLNGKSPSLKKCENCGECGAVDHEYDTIDGKTTKNNTYESIRINIKPDTNLHKAVHDKLQNEENKPGKPNDTGYESDKGHIDSESGSKKVHSDQKDGNKQYEDENRENEVKSGERTAESGRGEQTGRRTEPNAHYDPETGMMEVTYIENKPVVMKTDDVEPHSNPKI